jgi:hypothetical protein
MKIFPKIFKLLAVFSILAPTFLLAEGERVLVGEPKEQIEVLDDFDSEEASEFKDITRSGFSNQYPPVYYPASCHWIIKISALGDSLEIEDGSVWELNSRDGHKALYWRSRNPIMITQNTSWFSNYKYRILNQQSGESIESNLVLGPFAQGEYTNLISIMDKHNGALALTDNSNLQICSSDLKTFYNWSEGQSIIIGVNSGWHSHYDLILINVNMNDFVRARQY